MTTKKKNFIDGLVKIILIIITLASVGYSLFIYVQSEERREKDAATIQNQIDVITQSTFIINQHKKRIAELEKKEEEAINLAKTYRDSLNITKKTILESNKTIAELKEKIENQQTVVIVEGSVEEQYDTFIDWTESYDITLNLQLIDEIKEYNQTHIQIPTINMIAANAIYFNKRNLLINYVDLTEQQTNQIENYTIALNFAEEESAYYRSAYVNSQLINTELRAILAQERRRTIAFGVISTTLVGYILYETLTK